MTTFLLLTFLLAGAHAAQLTLWEHGGQSGRSVTLYGPSSYISELQDAVSSIRADSGTWELYVDVDYEGARMVVEEGFSTGAYWNDAISSARPVCNYITDPATAKLRVFEHHDAQGASKEYLLPQSYVGADWNDVITSVKAEAGDWELYSDAHFEGMRRVVREGEFLNMDGYNDVISSVRPVCETYQGADKCKLDRVEVLNDNDTPSFAGSQVIGSASGGTCYGGAGAAISMSNTDDVTESVEMTTGVDEEINWSVSLEVVVEASAKFLGSGGSVSVGVSAGVGGSRTLSHSQTKSYGKGSSVGVGVEVNYHTPGAALLFGVVDRYEYDNTNTPVRLHLTCPDGATQTRDSTMTMKSVTYQSASFVSLQGRFSSAACRADRGLPYCVDGVRAQYSGYRGDKDELHQAFERCFEGDKGSVDK